MFAFNTRESAERYLSRRRFGDIIAFDKKRSVRTYDSDGHLHIERAPVSKANVCEYYGDEIPDSEALGLEPKKKYKLLRDPKELEKAVHTLNGKPLLIQHIPVNSLDPQKDSIVGSVGTKAEYKHPYVYNALTVWDQDGIDGIEDDSQKELSSAYRYRADMTPGTYMGTDYDGVMRDIEFNHVALVPEGRAGADVVVGDAKPQQGELRMTKVLSRKAVYAAGVLSAFIIPRLAKDAKIDIDPILEKVSAKNFKQSKPKMLSGLNAALKGKLAKDASVDGLSKLLDMIEEHEVAEGADTDPNSGLPLNSAEMEMKKATDEEEEKKAKEDKGKEFLKSKLSAEDMAAYDDIMGAEHEAEPAEDAGGESKRAEENEEGEEGGGGEDAKHGKDKKHGMDSMISKKAMDEAIAKARKDTIKEQNAISEAREFVRPWAGKLAMDATSVDEVYKAALEGLGLQDTIKGVHPSAYRTILSMQPKPGTTPVMAHDSAPADTTGFRSRFKDLTDRIDA